MIRRTTLALLSLVLLAGCGGEPDAAPAPSQPASSSAPVAPVAPTPTPTADPLPPVTDAVSLPALMAERFTGGPITRVRTLAVTDAYRRFAITYPSGDLTVSGVLLVPTSPGPHPAVVLNHGYIDPAVYVSGQGLAREQDYLARAGYVVLHTDYRGHAGSDAVGPVDLESRLGYTRDTINAVLAVKQEPKVDPERVAMLGRSMGGGVTLNALVAQPGLVKAAVVYASVSSSFEDNFDRWTRTGRPEAAARFEDRFGTPAAQPGFWDGLSSRSYLDRITEPVLLHHGTSDDQCPVAWSRTTQDLLTRAGVDSTLRIYPGEEHAFVPQWELSMRRTVRFLNNRLA